MFNSLKDCKSQLEQLFAEEDKMLWDNRIDTAWKVAGVSEIKEYIYYWMKLKLKINYLLFLLNKLNKISGQPNILDRKYFNKIEICKLLRSMHCSLFVCCFWSLKKSKTKAQKINQFQFSLKVIFNTSITLNYY